MIARVLSLVAVMAAAVVSANQNAAVGSAGCGPRAVVGTLADKPKLVNYGSASIESIEGIQLPRTVGVHRLGIEYRVYRISPLPSATVVRRADGFVEFTLGQGARQIKGSIPPDRCEENAGPLRRRQVAVARRNARSCKHALVTGVVFAYRSAHTELRLQPALSFNCI